MQRLILAVLAAFVMALVFGPVVIPWLKKLKFGQTIYDLGPETHKKKQGTPTMGGIIFAVPAVIAAVAFAWNDTRWDFLIICLVCAVGFGLIGFVDDFIKVKLKRSLGLTPKQKLIPQIILSIGLSFWAFYHPEIGSKLRVPFCSLEWDIGWFYIPLMTFVLVGTVNSANLMDGLDGLLAGCSLFDFLALALLCLGIAIVPDVEQDTNILNVAVFCGAMAGALMGFLRYNSHPARVFMGDVGSFFIGGGLMGAILCTRYTLMLPIICLMLVVTSASDLIQFAYFRATHGKRFFRMAPFHHHLELGGMPETKIVTLYYIITAALCLVALL